MYITVSVNYLRNVYSGVKSDCYIVRYIGEIILSRLPALFSPVLLRLLSDIDVVDVQVYNIAASENGRWYLADRRFQIFHEDLGEGDVATTVFARHARILVQMKFRSFTCLISRRNTLENASPKR